MKKLLFVLLILLLFYGGYVIYDSILNKEIPKLDIEEEVVNVDNLFVFGNHLNMYGDIIHDDNLDLVLYNGEFLSYDIKIQDNRFVLADEVNRGINLEEIPRGKYFIFLRSSHKDEKDKDIYKYYSLKNNSGYDETTYYTFSNTNNKITINSDHEYNTLMFTVTENKSDQIYDIVIDPGHGGLDSGAFKNGYKESDFTMQIASNLKEKLESYGVKVKLTREENQLSNDEKLNDYGIHGRCVIPHEVNAKYLISIHMNSNNYASVNGLEVYTPANIDYTLAKNIADSIVSNAGISYSNNSMQRIYNGVYTRIFTQSDVQESIKEYKRNDLIPYDVTTKSNYYFMIREPGSIITGAYVDDRNSNKDGNPYFKSNIGVESYLLELGYLTNTKDLNNIINNMDKYTSAIADSFKDVFDNKL